MFAKFKRGFAKWLAVLLALVLSCGVLSIMPSMQTAAATTYTVIFPVNNGCKIAYYQKYDPNYSGHDGVDIHSNGDDTVYAAAAGKVVGLYNGCAHHSELTKHVNGTYGEMGNYIKIKGDDGIYYWYYHLKQNTLKVSNGTTVSAGQAIATMGDSGAATGIHLHFRMTTGSSYYSTEIIANPVGKYNGQVYYKDGPYGGVTPVSHNSCVTITAGKYYLKNSSTGTYMQAASASSKAKLSLALKKNTNAFQFQASGSVSAGYYLATCLGTSYVVNPFADSPKAGTTINIYSKNSDGTQLWEFDKSGSGYIIHMKSNPNLVLTASGSGVILQSRSSAATQVWYLEGTAEFSSITATLSRTTYAVGTSLDLSTVKVTANYTDGSTKDVTSNATFAYDFSTAGTKTVTVSYNGATATVSVSVIESLSGSGTESDPWQIWDKTDLEAMRDLVNDTAAGDSYRHGYYIQMADIDLESEKWMPIGVGYDGDDGMGDYNWQNRIFYGHYDGNEHYIYNLHIENAKEAGLFGFIRGGASVSNLVVTGSVASSYNNVSADVGGIVGEIQYNSSVTNCAFIGNSTCTYGGAGGIAGSIWCGGTISGCYHNGTVNGLYAGGMTGRIQYNDSDTHDTIIQNCYNAGGITGTTEAHSIAGIYILNANNLNVTVKIANCYAETLPTISAVACPSVTSDNTQALTTDVLKETVLSKLAIFREDIGSKANDGYPVFPWQVVAPSGDVNGDGTVDATDAMLLQQWLLGLKPTINGYDADVQTDGVINGLDLAVLRQMLLKAN